MKILCGDHVHFGTTVGLGCLGLAAGSLIVAGWLALNMFIAAAAVLAEIGNHGTL